MGVNNTMLLAGSMVGYSLVVLFELALGIVSNNMAMISDSSIVCVDLVGYSLNLASERKYVPPTFPLVFSGTTLVLVSTVLLGVVFVNPPGAEEEENTETLNIACMVINFGVDIAASLCIYRYGTPSIQMTSALSHITMDTLRTTLVLLEIVTDMNDTISNICVCIICLTGYANSYLIYRKFKNNDDTYLLTGV